MNDQSAFERIVADSVASIGALAPSDGAIDRTIRRASRTRQRPEWLALIKEPPMRISSSLAVGSPTARMAAILVAALLLTLMVAGAGIAGSRLLAADESIVVDRTGEGDFTTITDAVVAADSGDTILVHPGTYVEAVIVDKDLTLTGDGPVDDIVIAAPDDGPTTAVWASADPYAVVVANVDARLSNLTFRGERSEVIVKGGEPTLEGLVFEGVGQANESFLDDVGGSSIALTDGSTAVVRANRLVGGGPIAVFAGSEPVIEGNTLIDGPHIWGDLGDGGVIRDNIIERPIVRGIGVGQASPSIEGNTIVDSQDIGIQVHGGTPLVKGNRISGAARGIYVDTDDAAPTLEANEIADSREFGIEVNGSKPSIVDNVLRDNEYAIHWLGYDGRIEGNEISGGVSGIHIRTGAPIVSGNTVRGVADVGILVAERATPTLTDNSSCGNGQNLSIAEGARAVVGDGNQICEDDTAG